MRLQARVIKRAITAALLGLALMLSALSATAQTYGFTPTTGTFTSIRDNDMATLVGLSSRDNDADGGVFDTITIPFEFYFFGQEITSLVPTTNLWLTTNSDFICGASCSTPTGNNINNMNESGTLNHKGAIYPFWSDSAVGASSQVHHLTADDADSGGRVLTIEFSKFPLSPVRQSINLLSFQVRLYEANGNIEFRYGPIASGSTATENNRFTPAAFIGIAASASFFPDSDTTRYYSVQSLSPGPDPAPMSSTTTFKTFPQGRTDASSTTHDDRFPINEQIYRFTPTQSVILTPADVTATTGESIIRELPAVLYPQGAVTYNLTGLPTGFSFMASDRTIRGMSASAVTATPLTYTATDGTVTHSTTFMFTVINAEPDFDSQTIDPIVVINGVALDPLDPALTLPEAGIPSGASAEYRAGITYSITENLPPGLTFNAGMRRLTGTPTEVPEPASAMFTYIATDTDGDTAMLTFMITVEADIRLNVPTPSRELYILETNENVQPLLLRFPSVNEVGGNPQVTLDYMRTDPDFSTISMETRPDTVDEDAGWLTISSQGILGGAAPQDVSSKDDSVPQFSITGTYTDAGGEMATLTFNFQVIDVRPLPPSPEIDEDDFVFGQGEAIPPATTLPPFLTNVDDVEEIERPDLTYTLTGLPPGLTFDDDSREIRGTTTVVGDHPVTYKAAESGQDDTAMVTFTITVHPDVPSFVGPPIDELILTQNTPITNVTLPKAIGKDMPLDYSISPALPSGLSFDDRPDMRLLSGTPTVALLTSTEYTYTVADSGTPVQTASLTFNITVAEDLMPSFASNAEIVDITAIVNQAITSVNLPKVVENSDGDPIGTGAITYTITPAVPQALMFVANTDPPTLSGTPTATQEEITYTYKATDSDTVDPDSAMLTFTITVEADPELTPPANPAFVLVPGQTLDAASTPSGTLPPFTGNNGMLTYTLSNTQGLMDEFDLMFEVDAQNRPLITGMIPADDNTHQSVASMTFRYTATDDDDTADEADDDTGFVDITIEVVDALPVAPPTVDEVFFTRNTLTTFTLPAFTTTVDDNSDVTAPTLRYSLKPGHPTWLSIPDEDDPVISGTPPDEAPLTSHTVTYIASDRADEAEATFTLIVTDDPAPQLSEPIPNGGYTYSVGDTLPDLLAEDAEVLPFFETSYDEDGSTLTHTLANNTGVIDDVTNPLVGGLMYDSASRTIHGEVMGTPNTDDTATVTYTYEATETEDRGVDENPDTGSTTFTITIEDDVPSFASGAPIGDIPAVRGSSITHNPLPQVVANSDGIAIGTGIVTYSITPALPADLGLTFDGVSRMITGIPTRTLADPDNMFMYIATDEDMDTAMLPFTITVAENTPIVVPDTVQNFTFTIGSDINEVDGVDMLAFSGGDTSLTYAIDTAVRGLPNGLSLHSSTAVLSGTPEGEAGDDSFSSRSYTYIATDNKGTATEDDDESERHTFTITMVDEQPFAPTPSVTNLYFTPGQVLTGANVRTLPNIEGGTRLLSGDLTYAFTASQDLTTRFGLSLDLETNLLELSGSVLPADTDADNSVDAETYTYTATDDDMDSASATFTIRVVDARPELESTIVPYVFTAGVAEPLDLPMFGNNLPQNLPPNSGITEPTFTFTLTGDDLPDGITHDMENQQLTSDTSIVATDTDIDLTYRVQETGDADFDEVMLTLSVTDDPTPTPPRSLPPAGYTFTPGEIVNVILPNFTIAGDEDGSMLTHTLANAAGTEIDNSPSASLIGGLMYDQGSRAISGTVDGDDMDNDVAETTYTYSAIVTATPEQTDMTTFTIEIVDEQPVAPASTPDFTFAIGETLSDRAQPPQLPVFTGGTTAPNAPLTYALDVTQAQALMQTYGLTFNASDRTIEGRVTGTSAPDSTGPTTYSYTATDRDGDEAMADFTITLTDAAPAFATGPSPTIDPISGTQGTAIGTTESLPAVESIGSGGITYIFDPLLPNGLSFNQDTRVISGTPSAGLTETTFTYRARDVDGDLTPQSFSFTITIEATGDPVVMPLAAPTVMDLTFTVGQTLANPIVLPVFTGGNGALTYSLVGAEGNAVTTLVGGLTFTPNSREITGPVEEDTPANDNAAETYTYTATDGSATATVNFTITITDEDGLVPPTPQQILTFKPDGEEVTMTLAEFTGGSGTIMYSSDDVAEVMMEFGLTFTPGDRTISGSIPVGTTPKDMEYTYTATSGNESVSTTFTIAITDVPSLDMATASAIPTVGANIALVASQAISSRVELALDGLSSGIDIRTLDGPSLRLNPQQQNGGSSPPVRFGVWYSAASDSLSDTRGEVTWSGDTDSTNLGFDVGFDISASASLVVGILQNSSSTTATYRSTATGSTGSGTLSVDLDSTAFYVGLGYDWLDAWFANGSADSTLNDSATMLAIPASFSYQTIGLTASFEIIDSLSVGGKVESLTSDLSLAAMADDPRFDDGLATDSSQLRTAFVANYQLKLGESGNGLLIPKFEFGFRDLSLGTNTMETAVAAAGGSAMETSFGVDYIQRAWGLTVGLDMRSISVENYTSDSTQYQIRWESGNYSSGLSFQLTPHSVSETLGGIDSLYSGGYNQYQSVLERQRGGNSTQDTKGMDFEVGYGFVASYGTVTPYLKTTNYRGSGNRAQEFGIRYQTLAGLELSLKAERELTPQTIQILGFPLTFTQDESALTVSTRYSF